MTSPASSRPTLWRTCRVLANQHRLRILAFVAREPGQTVSEVANELRIALPTASLYLRALEARGFLQSKRVGRHVKYRFATGTDESTARLLAALRTALSGLDEERGRVFKLATAFTHPRRIEIVRVLAHGRGTVQQLQATTRVPWRALSRHLLKLHRRGLIVDQPEGYALATPHDPLAAALLELARN